MCTGLRELDVSFNELRAAGVWEAAAALPKLRKLYAIKNKVASMAALPAASLPALETLELGDNRIRVIEGIEPGNLLRELYLGNNKIVNVGDGLQHAVHLRILSLQANRITAIGEGDLAACTELEELYLSENGIDAAGLADGRVLAPLAKLKVLDLAQNRLVTVPGLEHCPALVDLWVNVNAIDDLSTLAPLPPALTTLYARGNPGQRVLSDPAYHEAVRAFAPPSLQYLDADAFKRQ